MALSRRVKRTAAGSCHTARRSYFFFDFFAFFLADFLAAFFFLATVTSSVKEFAAGLFARRLRRQIGKTLLTRNYQPNFVTHFAASAQTIRSTNATILNTKCVNVVSDICTYRKTFCNTIL
jgi:hypothetical protein